MVMLLERFSKFVVPLVISSLRFSSAFNMAQKTAAVIIADGTEDMEFVISVDVLRRAGINVTVVSLEHVCPVKLKTGTLVVPDTEFKCITDYTYDAVVLPGGPAYKAFCMAPAIGTYLKEQEKSDRLIAAICAAPVVLNYFNIGVGRKVTCYPTLREDMKKNNNFDVVDDKVVEDGNIITSQGPGTSYDFALTIVANLLGKPMAQKVADEMLYKFC